MKPDGLIESKESKSRARNGGDVSCEFQPKYAGCVNLRTDPSILQSLRDWATMAQVSGKASTGIRAAEVTEECHDKGRSRGRLPGRGRRL
jgi:hypothetical protein